MVVILPKVLYMLVGFKLGAAFDFLYAKLYQTFDTAVENHCNRAFVGVRFGNAYAHHIGYFYMRHSLYVGDNSAGEDAAFRLL